MTQLGVQLTEFVKSIRRFCQDLASLLGTVDLLMSEQGWVGATPQNIVSANTSAAIGRPEDWFPHDLFRVYRHAAKPHVFCSVSALLDPIELPAELTEPLLTTCIFDYGKPITFANGWKSWYSQFHGYVPSRSDDGTWHEKTPATWPDDKTQYPFERVLTRGLPLAEVSDAGVIEKNIVQPLLQRLGDL